MNTLDADVVNRLVDLGRSLGPVVQTEGGDPVIMLPMGFHTESLKAFFPPKRIERKVVLLEPGSFADYVNRFKGTDSLIFADVTDTGARFVAILDYHGAAPDFKPTYCAHVASFECMPTKEWLD